jgi:hypothetical protein
VAAAAVGTLGGGQGKSGQKEEGGDLHPLLRVGVKKKSVWKVERK